MRERRETETSLEELSPEEKVLILSISLNLSQILSIGRTNLARAQSFTRLFTCFAKRDHELSLFLSRWLLLSSDISLF